MNYKVVFLSVILLSACSSKNPYYEKLYGSWTCNGKGVSLAADTYHNNGKFSRYLHENGQVMLQEGIFTLNENWLQIKIDRQAFRINSEVAKLPAPIFYQYKIDRLSINLLDFRRSRPSVGPLLKQKLQTCRKVYEQRTGFFYASARIGRLEKESNKPGNVESPVTIAIREHASISATRKVVAIKLFEEKDSSSAKPENKLKNKGSLVLVKNKKSIGVKEPTIKNSIDNKSSEEKKIPLVSKKDHESEISKDAGIKSPVFNDSTRTTIVVDSKKSSLNAPPEDKPKDEKDKFTRPTNNGNKRIVVNNKNVIITLNKSVKKNKLLEKMPQSNKKVIVSTRSKPALKPNTETEIRVVSKNSDNNARSGIPPNIKNLLRKQNYLARQIKILDALQRDRNRAYDTLRALSQAMVPRLSLTSVQQKDNKFTITGRATESAAVSLFTKNLSHSPHLRKVRLGRVYTHGDGKNFTINFQQAHSVKSYQYLQVRQAMNQQNRAGAKRRIRELSAIRDSLLKRFPSEIEAQLLVRKLKWKAKKVGLKVIRFERQKDIKQGSYNLVQVRIEAVGDYDSIIVFLNRLGRRKHVNRVRNLQLRIQSNMRSHSAVVESLYISMTLDLIRMSDKLQRQRKRVPNLKFRFVEMAPYNRVPYSDDEGLRNPFRFVTGRFVEYCNGPLNNVQISKVMLVAILNKRKHMALLKTPDGKIYRARYGTCIARNTRISRITHKSIVLKTVKVKYGRPTVVVRSLKLQTE